MSGINIKNLYIEKLRKDWLPNQLEEAQLLINYYMGRIRVLAAVSPHPVKGADGEDINWVDYLVGELKDVLDGLEESIADRTRIKLALDNFDHVEDVK